MTLLSQSSAHLILTYGRESDGGGDKSGGPLYAPPIKSESQVVMRKKWGWHGRVQLTKPLPL